MASGLSYLSSEKNINDLSCIKHSEPMVVVLWMQQKVSCALDEGTFSLHTSIKLIFDASQTFNLNVDNIFFNPHFFLN